MADIQQLIRLAMDARDRAYAPYSDHPVGAALLADNGETYAGCNVENTAYPLGTCAEQSAIAAMVRGGGRIIRQLVVVGPDDLPCAPCGGCRQRIREFATPETVVRFRNERGKLVAMTMDELLPEPFGPDKQDNPNT